MRITVDAMGGDKNDLGELTVIAENEKRLCSGDMAITYIETDSR